MKNKVLYTLISLFALGNVSAAEIGSATRQEIGRTLSRIVSREVTSGYQKPEPITVRVQAVKASRSRVRIYATAALANYPFREENLRAMRDSVRALLPHEFRTSGAELHTAECVNGVVNTAVAGTETAQHLTVRRIYDSVTAQSGNVALPKIKAILRGGQIGTIGDSFFLCSLLQICVLHL